MQKTANLADKGLKATGPRLKILELFETKGHRHLCAEDVYRLLAQDGIDVGVATVYRVLTQFEQAGLLNRLMFDGGKSVYELNDGDHHDHMVCMKCASITEFLDPKLEALQEKIADEYGFALHEHALYLFGVCKNCQ